MRRLEAELFAALGPLGRGEPFLVGDRAADRFELIRSAVGHDLAVHVGQHQVDVHSVRIEDHAQPLRRELVCLGCTFRERVHDAAVGRPPTHVARSLVKIAVDQIDVRKRDV